MITIISPDKFNTIPWKNGLGFTTELAINDGATLDNFDWRLSIASVTEDGEFSNFSGYNRNLVLIEGNGISLVHDKQHTDKLTQSLDIAKFDGGFKTTGVLHDGAIKDFNIMTKHDKTKVKVDTVIGKKSLVIKVDKTSFTFIYSLSGVTNINNNGELVLCEQGSLAKVTNTESIEISGPDMIIVTITLKK
jgi:environmental stress-induced protein Ves